jgi:uncharacterized protein YjdB
MANGDPAAKRRPKMRTSLEMSRPLQGTATRCAAAAGSAPLLAVLLLAGCPGDNPAAPEPPAVATIEVRHGGSAVANLTLEAFGDTLLLTARALASDGTIIPGKSFTWSSSSEAVATVSSGEVRAVGTGLAVISAHSDGRSGLATVQVTQVPSTVTVAPAELTLVSLQDTARLSATVRDRNGHLIAASSALWITSDSTVVAVGETGLVTAVGSGSATITARAQEVSGTATVHVAQVVSAVEVTPPTAAVAVGSTVRLIARALDARGSTVGGVAFVWSSANAALARVDEAGLVTGVAAGEPVTITAAGGGQSGSAEVTVTPAPVATVEVAPLSATVRVGGTQQLTATLRDSVGNVLTGRNVTWSSSNDAVATVSAAGLVTGVTEGGPIAITASSEGQSGASSLTVTPMPPVPTTLHWSFCNERDVPIWFAFQNESEPWTRVTGIPTGEGVRYSFDIGERGGVAFKKPSPSSGPIWSDMEPAIVFYGTAEELAALVNVRCAIAGSKTLTGSADGIPQGERMRVSFGTAEYEPGDAEATAFRLDHVATGAQDLLASTSGTPRWQPSRVIIRRGLEIPSQGAIPPLDFSSPESFESVQRALTVTNSGSQDVFVSVRYLMSNSSVHYDGLPFEGRRSSGPPFLGNGHFEADPSAGSGAYPGIPAAQQRSGDLHMLVIETEDPLPHVVSGRRGLIRFFHRATDQVVGLGPSMTSPSVSTAGTSPYVRLRFQILAQADYDQTVWIRYGSLDDDISRRVIIAATANYFGGRVVTWDITMPDLAGAGFDPGWMPISENDVWWDVEAFGWSETGAIEIVSPVGYVFGPPADGATIRHASVPDDHQRSASQSVRRGGAPASLRRIDR